MIDPTDVTNFNRTTAELEEFLLFCVSVAGKQARRQAVCLENFINALPDPGKTPFERIKILVAHAKPTKLTYWSVFQAETNIIKEALEKSRIGQYIRISSIIQKLVAKSYDLQTVSVETLMEIDGIGPKTARFFVLHSRAGQQIGVLDTHILKYLASQGFHVPAVTPSSAEKYKTIESIFLYLAKQAGKTPADFDLEIWNEHSAKANGSKTV